MSEKPKGYIDSIFNQVIKAHPSSFDIETKGFIDELDVAMAIDFKSYLPNDILAKVDRATMSQSIEGREPFLDHRLLEFVAQIPIKFKYNGKEGKLILKDIVHELVPKELMNRPKIGFDLPIFSWLKDDLSYLLDEYLSKEALTWSGIFDHEFILKEVNKFKSDKLHYSSIIWNILIFQMWYKKWILKG
jgi:asparagine synthase (glutamine-hydrolysing)